MGAAPAGAAGVAGAFMAVMEDAAAEDVAAGGCAAFPPNRAASFVASGRSAGGSLPIARASTRWSSGRTSLRRMPNSLPSGTSLPTARIPLPTTFATPLATLVTFFTRADRNSSWASIGDPCTALPATASSSPSTIDSTGRSPNAASSSASSPSARAASDETYSSACDAASSIASEPELQLPAAARCRAATSSATASSASANSSSSNSARSASRASAARSASSKEARASANGVTSETAAFLAGMLSCSGITRVAAPNGLVMGSSRGRPANLGTCRPPQRLLRVAGRVAAARSSAPPRHRPDAAPEFVCSACPPSLSLRRRRIRIPSGSSQARTTTRTQGTERDMAMMLRALRRPVVARPSCISSSSRDSCRSEGVCDDDPC